MANTQKVQAASLEVLEEMKTTFSPERVLILFSGGADSVFMLHLAEQMGFKVDCILFNYGQLHIEELDVAIKYLENNKTDFRIIEVVGLNINSGLTGDGIKNSTEVVHEMHVPMRNTMFLSIACSIAEAGNINKVWIDELMD